MLGLLECVAQAVVNKGVRGLAEFVPGGPYLLDVAGDAFRLFRERKRNTELRDELVQAAAAGAEDARRAAEEVARKVAGQAPIEDRIALELYLTQIPGCVRQSMKRADDPSGKSVPADFAVTDAAALARVLPARAPRFRSGADLPGRSGWRLDELLGAGGFGEVWLARHTFIPNPRAVKFCTDPVAKSKLASHEGKLIARVMAHGHHPNVVPLVDAVLDGESPWLMYEYVGGGDLTDLVHRWQGLPPADRERAVVGALHELATAVGTFHRLVPPLVHRDLKPSNILLTTVSGDGGLRPGLRITDFGIGGVAVDYLRTPTAAGASLMTGWLETSMRGSYTPLYASPQQRSGAAPDPRDDVHALGVIGYQLATGHLHQAPGIDAADDLRDASVGEGLIQLLTRCVAQKPDRRPKDAWELAEKLAALLGTAAALPPAVPEPPVTTPPTARPVPVDAKPKPPPVFVPGPLDGGPLLDRPTRTSSPPAAAVPLPSKPAPVPPPSEAARPARYLIPFRATWFSRPADSPDAPWVVQSGRLPGEVSVRPAEAYRLAFTPDDTTDATLAKVRAVGQIPNLEAIDLSGCAKVTDAGLAHLAGLPHLKAVGLGETGVTDSGVALLLGRFPGLEAVGLAGAAAVTRAVVPDLARLRNLKVLSLPPKADTVDVRAELARRRPGCAVV